MENVFINHNLQKMPALIKNPGFDIGTGRLLEREMLKKGPEEFYQASKILSPALSTVTS